MSDILKTLRTFVYKNQLNRDRDKWVLELGEDESLELIKHIYFNLCPQLNPNVSFNEMLARKTPYPKYFECMTLSEFLWNREYEKIKTFKGIAVEWFKPKLAFRENNE